jgi:hypothetical protein
MTKDAAQRSLRTFYEVVNYGDSGVPGMTDSIENVLDRI